MAFCRHRREKCAEAAGVVAGISPRVGFAVPAMAVPITAGICARCIAAVRRMGHAGNGVLPPMGAKSAQKRWGSSRDKPPGGLTCQICHRDMPAGVCLPGLPPKPPWGIWCGNAGPGPVWQFCRAGRVELACRIHPVGALAGVRFFLSLPCRRMVFPWVALPLGSACLQCAKALPLDAAWFPHVRRGGAALEVCPDGAPRLYRRRVAWRTPAGCLSWQRLSLTREVFYERDGALCRPAQGAVASARAWRSI